MMEYDGFGNGQRCDGLCIAVANMTKMEMVMLMMWVMIMMVVMLMLQVACGNESLWSLRYICSGFVAKSNKTPYHGYGVVVRALSSGFKV